jgi:hypothetical protein
VPVSDEITQQMYDEWVEAAVSRGDAQAAYRVGEYGLDHPMDRTAEHFFDQAEPWLRRAADLGGVPMLWQIAELTKDWNLNDFGVRWHREAVSAEWGGTDVLIDPGTLCHRPGGGVGGADTSLYVRGEPDEAVRVAMTAARDRMFCVGSDGVEYADAEAALNEAEYSPNYVSDPEARPGGGWSLLMDWKGCRFSLMAATDLRILVEELRKAGATSIHISTDPPE